MNVSDGALYKGSDKRLYEILSFDSDTAVLCNADRTSFTVAVKPFFDEINNVIDFSAAERFSSLSEAKTYSQELKTLFSAERRYVKPVRLSKDKMNMSVNKGKRRVK